MNNLWRAGSISDRSSFSYRYASLHRLSLAAAEDCLSLRERVELAGLRDRSRRNTWLAGRFVLKQLLTERLAGLVAGNANLAEVEINSRDGQGTKIRPWAAHAGRRLPFTLSLSHSHQAVLAAIAPLEVAIGVDLAERDVRLGRGFAQLWFTGAERQWLAEDRLAGMHAVWAIKEAAYKALNQGEPFEPQRMQVEPRGHGGYTCRRVDVRPTQDCRITLWHTECNELAVLATYQNSPSEKRNLTTDDTDGTDEEWTRQCAARQA